MPIYEYRCEECGHQFERLARSIHDESLELVCPSCEGAAVRRLISAPTVRTSAKAGGSTEATETPAPKPPVFGRKELNEVLRSRRT